MSERFNLQSVINRVKLLPPLPQAVLAVMRALEHDELSADHCVRLVERDQALAARTMRVANSAFYGVPGRVARIGDAVSMLGLRTLSGILAVCTLSDGLQPQRCPGFVFSAYWRHALGVALCARALAPRLGADPEQAFLAGLMHDSGQLVLAAYFPAEASATLAIAMERDCSASAAELELLGLSHAEIGASLARHWHFPAAIAGAIAAHHGRPESFSEPGCELAALVHLGDAVAHALGLSGLQEEAVPEMDGGLWQRLGLDQNSALALLARVERGVQELSSALAV